MHQGFVVEQEDYGLLLRNLVAELGVWDYHRRNRSTEARAVPVGDAFDRLAVFGLGDINQIVAAIGLLAATIGTGVNSSLKRENRVCLGLNLSWPL